MEFLIVKTLHIRINTTDNIEDHSDDDDQSSTRDQEVDLCRSERGKSEYRSKLGREIGKYCDKCEKPSSEKVESVRDFL